MLLRLFRSLMPHEENFVDRFAAHARQVVDGAHAFRELLAGRDFATQYAAICRHEEAADTVASEIERALHRSFIIPFDRMQILDLTTALDDTIDLMKKSGRRIRLYDVAFTPEMLAMADCAVRASAAVADTMPLLSGIAQNVPAFEVMQGKVRDAESQADELLDRGLRTLFGSDLPTGDKLKVEKVYDLIEAIVDRCEDVADVIAGIVVEQV